MKQKFVEGLVRLYPARWRREYGAEFVDVLSSRPLGARAVLDVISSAMRQQARHGEPWFLVGVPLLIWSLLGWTSLILFPVPYTADSFKNGWPVIGLGCLTLISVGFWTVMRNGPEARGGRAAMKASMLINWPLSAIALLAGLGVLRILVVGPGDPVTTFQDHGFAFTYYDHARRSPGLFGLFVIPFLGLPEALFFGWLGGHVAKALLKSRGLLHR